MSVDPATLPDLAVFKEVDAGWCPEMVVIPAGRFLMGADNDEIGSSTYERPQHPLTIGERFAIGRYAVTFEEYDHFCDATDREKPADAGWGRGRRPVINVTRQDAKAYGIWLARRLGRSYGLPTEAEWEYACRAGTTTPLSFGNEITSDDANFHCSFTDWYNEGEGQFEWEQTILVGHLPANPWGLYEMHGNVWEWVEDVWHASYAGAPADGRAWTDGVEADARCRRVVRGGSWVNRSCDLRSACRYRAHADDKSRYIGFRIACNVFRDVGFFPFRAGSPGPVRGSDG